MTVDVSTDLRLDPRLRALLGAMPQMEPLSDVISREELLAEANRPEVVAGREAFTALMDACDTDDVAPSAGLRVSVEEFVSQPDGNTVKLRITRPDSRDVVPCVYYIHGGGMAPLSAFDGMYRGWAKIIAANGVAVVMVDFRNSVTASSAP